MIPVRTLTKTELPLKTHMAVIRIFTIDSLLPGWPITSDIWQFSFAFLLLVLRFFMLLPGRKSSSPASEVAAVSSKWYLTLTPLVLGNSVTRLGIICLAFSSGVVF